VTYGADVPADRPLIVRLGLVAWSFIGIVGAGALIVMGLAAVSSVVLPLIFAGVMAVLFRPVVARAERAGVPSGLAAAGVLLLLLLALVGLGVLVQRGIVSQSDEIVDEVVAALEDLDVDESTIADVRASLEDVEPSAALGVAKVVVSGLSTVASVVTGLVLGALIMYYLLKDGPSIRRQLIDRAPPHLHDDLVLVAVDAVHVLRRYWLGRTIVSAVVAAVVGIGAAALGLPLVLTLVAVTFVGGYIPYLGAVLGGALAVFVAVATGGIVPALAMLAIVLVANLGVENLVEPAVTGRTLQIHPLVVLLVTTAGGLLGGLPGLVLAVPLTVTAARALRTLWPHLDIDAERVRETLDRAAG
jgi:predicted PurR-regulated permease PerM